MVPVLLLLIVGLLLAMGRLVYGKRSGVKKWTFVKVSAYFIGLLVSNAILFIAVFAICLAAIASLLYFVPEELWQESQNSADTVITLGAKFPTVTVMLLLLLVIFTVSLLQVLLRKLVLRILPQWRMSEEEYEISEYLIQWLTIYVVVYQMLFQSIRSLGDLLPEITDWQNSFQVLLSPENINAVIQPLLIATWIAIVLEKLTLRHQQNNVTN